MSATPPVDSSESRPQPAAPPRRRLPRRALLLVALAFAAGLALCLILLAGRRDDEFFHAGDPAGPRPGQVFEPLPTPGSEGIATPGAGAPAAAPATPSQAGDGRGLPGDAMAPPSADPFATPPAGSAPDLGGVPPPPAGDQGRPDTPARPIRQVQPDYPASAIRRGESGIVRLEVHVDAQGTPERVEVIQSSRSRQLDREAQRAVQRWRFAPATRGGAAVPSRVVVPVEFDPGRRRP